MIGRVTEWLTTRRYGFVRAGGCSHFAHGDDLVDNWTPRRDDLVDFFPVVTERGPRAKQIRRIEAVCGKCGSRLVRLTCGRCGWRAGT